MTEEFKQPNWYEFFNIACKERRDMMLSIADELIVIHKESNQNVFGYVDMLDRLQNIRKSCEAMPKNCDELTEYIAVGKSLDQYSGLIGGERKKNESNNVYRDRIHVVENVDHGEMMKMVELDCSHDITDELMQRRMFTRHQLDQFIKWLNAESTVAWSQKTAMREFADETPLWKRYVEEK